MIERNELKDQMLKNLAALGFGNHGKPWKSLMHAHLGDYEKMEEMLKRWNSK